MKKFKVYVNGEAFEVEVEGISGGGAPEAAGAPPQAAAPQPAAPQKESTPAQGGQAAKAPETPKPAAPAGGGTVTSPMPGNINEVRVKAGDQVNKDDVLLVLEAMKMENEIPAPVSGTVKEVKVEKGQAVNNGDVLVVID